MIGLRLRYLRKRARLKLDDIAQRCGVRVTYLENLEKRNRGILTNSLREIVNAIGGDPYWVAYGNGGDPSGFSAWIKRQIEKENKQQNESRRLREERAENKKRRLTNRERKLLRQERRKIAREESLLSVDEWNRRKEEKRLNVLQDIKDGYRDSHISKRRNVGIPYIKKIALTIENRRSLIVKGPREPTEQIKRIIELYNDKNTLKEIGREFGFTHERSRQILKLAASKGWVVYRIRCVPIPDKLRTQWNGNIYIDKAKRGLKYPWKCDICKNEWKTTISYMIFSSKGCPKCSRQRSNGNQRKTKITRDIPDHIRSDWDENFDIELAKSNSLYKFCHRGVDPKTGRIPCGKIWHTRIHTRVGIQKSGCPHCNKRGPKRRQTEAP